KSHIILQEYELDMSECKDIKKSDLPLSIQEDYKDKDFTYKVFSIVFDNHTREYVCIIPTRIPKILQKAFEEHKEAQENKDYGYGAFTLIDDTYKEYKQESIYSKEIWLMPAQCKKLTIEIGV
ncbi:hypothetical protein CQA53_10110, partial [Helicobacter didelphidarum]